MAKQTSTPESPSSTDSASTPQTLESITPQPQALEVDAPTISTELHGTITAEAMEKDSYLTVSSRMDSLDITVTFSIKEAPEIRLNDVVDSSGQPGARKILIPQKHLTMSMGFTLVVGYKGTVSGKPAVSLAKEVGVSFYSAEQSKALAPRLRDEKIFQNTPTYDMHDHKGDEIVEIPIPPLAQVGDKIYCSVVLEQFSGKPVFYIVVYGYALTLEDIASGKKLEFPIPRGWLARQKPRYESITCQGAWITSGEKPQPPAEVENPDEETRLPRNALQIQDRRTAAFIGDQGLENLKPPHLRQSVLYNREWHLNPVLTKNGGEVDALNLDTYAGDHVCFTLSGVGYDSKPLGCVTIANDGDMATVELSACDIACFFNKKMTLSYTLEFPNGEEPQTSPEQVVTVSVPEFSRSNIEQATGRVLDLRTFTGGATALVPVWDYAECSKCCWMWITGEDEDGAAYRFDVLVGAPVTGEWKESGVDAPILRADLRKLADCSEFELHFAVSFCEATGLENAHEFPAQTFKIEQEPLVLTPPEVTEAVGTNLTAYNGRHGVHVEVDYVGNNSKHSIIACWKRPNGTCWPLVSKPGNSSGAVIFELPAEAVIESMGTTVEIVYTVTTACKVQTSPPLNLTISLPVRLETPNVLEATPPRIQDAVLDLRTFSGNANSLEDSMWFLRAGQKCWLRVDGTGKDGNPYSFYVYSARTITTAEASAGVAGPVLRSELEKFKDSTELTLTFSVATDDSLIANVVCPSRVLKVVAPPEIRYENFTGEPTNLISAGQSISISTMLISFISGPGQAGISSYSTTPGMLEGQALVLSNGVGQASSPQHIRMDLTFTCKRVKFAYTWNHYPTSFAFYNSTGDHLRTVSLNGNPTNGWVDFPAPENETIGRIDIRSGDWMYLDFFTFWL